MNWVDILIVLIVIFSVIGGFTRGFVSILMELVFVLAGLLAAVTFYRNAGHILDRYLFLPYGLANFIGFFLVSGIVNAALSIIFRGVKKRVEGARKSPIDRLFGIAPQLVMTFVGLSFTLALVLSYPVSRPVKAAIERSRFGQPLAQYAEPYVKR